MRNRNNASLNTVRGTLHLTDAEARRLISAAMTHLYAEKARRGLTQTEVDLIEKIEAGRKAQPGAF